MSAVAIVPKFQIGDKVVLVDRADKDKEPTIYTISKFASSTPGFSWFYLGGFHNKYTIDGSFREDWLMLHQDLTFDYDPTQAGDRDDDI